MLILLNRATNGPQTAEDFKWVARTWTTSATALAAILTDYDGLLEEQLTSTVQHKGDAGLIAVLANLLRLARLPLAAHWGLTDHDGDVEHSPPADDRTVDAATAFIRAGPTQDMPYMHTVCREVDARHQLLDLVALCGIWLKVDFQ